MRVRSFGFAVTIIAMAVAIVTGLATARAVPQRPKPLSARQIQGLVAGGVDNQRITILVESRGIDFEPRNDFLQALRKAGADEALLDALSKARRVLPSTPAQHAATTSSKGQASAGPPAMAAELVRSAQGLEQQQKWSEAERDYRSALKLDPRNAEVHFALGHVLEQTKKWDDAVAEFRQAEALGPQTAGIHRALGLALEMKHDTNGAVTEYRQALAVDSNDAEIGYKLGLLLYAQGEPSEAVAAYRAAARVKPDDAEIERKLALALYVTGELDGAVAADREAIRIEPNDARAHNDLGDALLKKGERLAALEEYRKAFELAPNDSTLQSAYPQIVEELQHKASAKPALQGSR